MVDDVASRRRRALVLALSVALAALVLLVRIGAQEAGSATRVAAPPGAAFYGLTPQFAVSPDGREIVFVATRPGEPPALWARALPSGTARLLGGTSQASYPFWSADGREVGFFAGGVLKRVSLGGGAPSVVCDAPTGRGGTWNRDGIIVFASGIGDPLRKVAATGGAVTPVTTLDTPRENSHRWPSFLPDGVHVMFWAGAGTAAPVLKIAALEGGSTVTVGPSASNGTYANGHVFHAVGTTLVAQPFDPVRLVSTAPPVEVVTPISTDAGSFFASFATAATGAVLYTQGTARPMVLTWFDRSGTTMSTVGDPGQYTNVNISRDGRRLAVSRTAGVPPNRDIWTIDPATGGATRLTTDAAVDASPVWAPDDSAVVFSSQRAGPYQMYRRAFQPGSADDLLLPSSVATIATDWSVDGRYLAYTRASPETSLDIWILPLSGDRVPFAFVESPAPDDNAMFAPDGRAVAYQSRSSGRDEIYLRPFPEGGEAQRVSAAGGTQPRWRADGAELFYLAPDGSVVAVTIAQAPGRWSVGDPRVIVPATMSLVIRQAYAVAGDGQRVLTPVLDPSNPPVITVVPAWTTAVAVR